MHYHHNGVSNTHSGLTENWRYGNITFSKILNSESYKSFVLKGTWLPEIILSVKRVASLPPSECGPVSALPVDSSGIVSGVLSSLKVFFLRDAKSVDTLSAGSVQWINRDNIVICRQFS